MTPEEKELKEEQSIEKAMNLMFEEIKKQDERNRKLLSDHNIPVEDMVSLLDYCTLNGDLEIVTEPMGKDQDESEGVFIGVYVDQWSVGDSGDSFAGFIYGKLSEGKWLKIPYNC